MIATQAQRGEYDYEVYIGTKNQLQSIYFDGAGLLLAICDGLNNSKEVWSYKVYARVPRTNDYELKMEVIK
jgi:hypothetical protein